MIGLVAMGNGRIIARLNGVDDWTVTAGGKPDPALKRSITAMYSGEFHGPEHGAYGVAILNDLAAKMGGIARFARRAAAPPGMVF